MKSVMRECALLLTIVAVLPEPALARSYLNCLAKKVVIVDTPSGSSSSSLQENLGFQIDEAAKTVVLADGTPLTVRRFDDRWISAARGDLSYEFDRSEWRLNVCRLDHEGGSCDDHNWVRPLQNCSRSAAVRRLRTLQLAFSHHTL